MGKLTLLVLVLAGCAMSPLELREEGERLEFTSTAAPRDIAQCIARNADNYKPSAWLAGPFPANAREGFKAGSFEVVVQHPAGHGFVMVADVRPHLGGALVSTWLTPYLIDRDMPERIVEPCGAQRVR